MIVVQTPAQSREQAKLIMSYGVKPEMEIFDSGTCGCCAAAEGLIQDPPLFQLRLGIPWGAPYDSETMAYQKSQLPGAIWAAFGIGRNEFPAVAQAVLLGGHVRVGLEDNLWLEKGVYASNGTLVEKAVKIIELLGTRVASPDEGRRLEVEEALIGSPLPEGEGPGWVRAASRAPGHSTPAPPPWGGVNKSSTSKTTPIKTVGIAGTGLIGAGWAARCLFRGLNVIAFDVRPEAEERLKAQIKTAWPSLEALLGKPVRRASSHSPPISRRWRQRLTSSMKLPPSAKTSRSGCSRTSTRRRGRR